jgi:hypothetical protein
MWGQAARLEKQAYAALQQVEERAGSSPAQLAGLNVPDDPLVLLGLNPKVLI